MYKIKRFSRTDRMEFTHATATKNVGSILKNGLIGSYSRKKNNITNLSRNITGSRKPLVYLSTDGRSAKFIKEVNDKSMGGGTILHISIPKLDFKKMKVVDNPEFLGTKSYEEFITKYKKKFKSTLAKSSIPTKEYYDMMTRGTCVIEGDVDAKYIKESPKYEE